MPAKKPSDARTKHAEDAGDAIARCFAELGLEVPTLLDAAMEGKTPNYVGTVRAPDEPDPRKVRYADLVGHGWPHRALNDALNADPTRPAIVAVTQWEARHCTFVLSGEKGTGKTVASAWHALRAKRQFRFVRTAELVKSSRFDSSWDAWLKAPALCVDDLGAEYADVKGSFLSDLDLLIDTFYSDERPLIITTNCGPELFAERYGGRIADRLKQCATWVNVEEESLR